MPEFQYRGRTGDGNLIEGSLTASSVAQAASQLQADGVLVLSVKPGSASCADQGGAPSASNLVIFGPQIRPEEVILLTRQLMALIRSGVPIIRALNGLSESASNPEIKRILTSISQKLIAGGDLTGAFSQHTKVFSPIYINMIHIGETTGKLTEAFEALIEHLERERETQRKMKAALRYPIMVVGSVVVALSVVTLYVIPSFEQVFASLGSDLPLPTKILMTVSTFAVDYGFWILGALIAYGIYLWHYQTTEKGGVRWDEWMIRLPLLGSVYERLALARFSRALALMMGAGVPILRCLSIVSDSVGNRYVAHSIRDIQGNVERGVSLTQAAVASGLFTPLVLQMLSIGEETGAVDRLMTDVANFYDEEVDYELKRMAEAVEPILLVFMGLLVMLLAVGVFLPIWEMGSAAANH